MFPPTLKFRWIVHSL